MKKTLFTSKLDLNLREKLVKCYFGVQYCMVLKPGHFGGGGGNTETAGKFSNVVLEKYGEDQLDRSCEKRSRVTQSQRGKEYPSCNEKSEG
jgi:hypothetical protein